MRKPPSTDRISITDEQLAQLQALKGQPNIDDIPEAPGENWQSARHFYKPRKEAISIRLDADVLDWLRRRSERYQTEINKLLREKMEEVESAGR